MMVNDNLIEEIEKYNKEQELKDKESDPKQKEPQKRVTINDFNQQTEDLL